MMIIAKGEERFTGADQILLLVVGTKFLRMKTVLIFPQLMQKPGALCLMVSGGFWHRGSANYLKQVIVVSNWDRVRSLHPNLFRDR